MKKFLKRFTRTQIILIFFIPFGAYGLWSNGLPGLLASIFGYGLGWFLCERWDRIRKFPLKKFVRRHLKAIVQLSIFIPLASYFTYKHGLQGLAVAIIGWCIGELISRKIFKFKD